MGLIQKLTDIATAISDKTGKPASEYTLDEMPNAIRTIQTEFPEVVEDKPKAVIFYDYDGSVVANFSYEELEHLTQLPELPTHEGLIATGWSSSLGEVKSVVEPNRLDVGVLYSVPESPNNIATVLYLTLSKQDIPVTLYFKQTMSNGVKIDWGDGSDIETVEGTDNVSATHTYTENSWSKPNVVLTLTPDDDCTLTLGQGTNTTLLCSNKYIMKGIFLGRCTLTSYCLNQMYNLKRIFFSNYITTIPSYMCRYNYKLGVIIIPNGITKIEDYAFSYCKSLPTIILPNGLTTIGPNAFEYCMSLKSIILPNGLTTINNFAFQYCTLLRELIIPDTVVSLQQGIINNCYGLEKIKFPQKSNGNNISMTFQYCYSLKELIMPDGVTNIGSVANYCDCLKEVTIPNSVTTINSAIFYNCQTLRKIKFLNRTNSFLTNNLLYSGNLVEVIDLSTCPKVITLSGTISNLRAETILVVPDELYDSWIVAPNWANYAKQIVKASEYTEQ